MIDSASLRVAMDQQDDKLVRIQSLVLEQQQNSCSNCGIDFSSDDVPRFRYVLPPDQGGEVSEDNVEAVCSTCFEESASEPL